MIFVTVGTTRFPFDRLLRAIEELGDDEEIVAQYGSSRVRPQNATCIAVMSYQDIVAHMQRARVVLSHAGVGSILTAALVGKRPLVVPRRAALAEAVDDHQLEIANALHERGSVVHVRDLASLRSTLSTSSCLMDPLAGSTPLARIVAEVARGSFERR